RRAVSDILPSYPRSLLSSYCAVPHALLSFPTRRSSDLPRPARGRVPAGPALPVVDGDPPSVELPQRPVHRNRAESQARGDLLERDRKSTRLNSSHVKTSYAVFCLKRKTKHNYPFR